MIERLVIQLAVAINMRTLYPANHPRVIQAVAQALAVFRSLLEGRKTDSLTFLLVGEDLVFEQQPLRKGGLSQKQFVEVLRQRGIERLTLAAGLDEAECRTFVSALATGETPHASPHIILGKVQVALEDSGKFRRQNRELSEDQIDVVRESFARFRTDRQLPLADMEELVWSFIDSLSRATRGVLPLARLREHDEYTFIHSVNVSMLVLAQARSFGIEGNMLHAFGMGGLLHDIGKLMVPLDVLNFPGKLEGAQWALMQSHAEQGAWYLSELENSMPLSILVAYEHHMRFDRQPNYPVTRPRRVPNLASRMTSIADTYDAMSTLRPYQKPKMRATAFEVLQQRSGTWYDPVLVPNFIRLVNEAV